jgi:hypothetical protein
MKRRTYLDFGGRPFTAQEERYRSDVNLAGSDASTLGFTQLESVLDSSGSGGHLAFAPKDNRRRDSDAASIDNQFLWKPG